MITLDTRSRDILLMLLQTETPLAASDIASQLNVTPRMVRHCLGRIEKWLETGNVRLVKKRGAGICIDAQAQTRSKLTEQLENLSGYPLLLSPAERVCTLTLLLLTTGEPIQTKQLQRYLGVSRTTVFKDLEKAGAWLRARDLRLMKRPNFGCQVHGTESRCREATVEFLQESAGETRLLVLCGGSRMVKASKRGDIGFERALHTYLETLKIAYAKQLVTGVERAMGIQFLDGACVSLVLHLATLIRRVEEGKIMLAPPEHLLHLKERPEFLVADNVAGQMEQRLNLRLSEAERIYIATQLLKAEARRPIPSAVGTRTNGADVTPAVLDIVQDMVAKASLYLHPYLRLDQELTQNLATHLARVFDQLSLGMPIRNPLLEDIKKQYPHVFKAAKESGLVLGSALGRSVSEEEVGYITLYLVAALERLRPPSQARYNVLVVCSAGVATAHLLASRIRAEFPEVAIVDVISALELQRRRRLDDIDLIVCTIPVEVEYGDMRAVLVSPFLDNQDRVKLKRALEAQAQLSPGSGQADDQGAAKVSLSDVMTARTVSIGVRARNWQEVIDRTGRLLLSTGGIEARYIDAMKDVVTQYGPYMVAWPGIALLHARPEDGVRRVCMSLVTLGEPVSFGHPSNDPVDVAIALAAVDSHSHLPALLELHSILVNKEAIGMIRQAVFKSEILYVIAHAAQAGGASQGS